MRELGIELHRIRKRAGYPGGDVGALMNWNASTVSRLENGLCKVPDRKLALYLARAKSTPVELDELVSLARRPDDGYQVRPHPAGFPDSLPIITMLDHDSSSITSYDPVEVPRHLQVEPYIRDALRRHGYDDQALDTAVKTRLALHPSSLRQPGSFTFYLSETALHSTSVPPTVTHEQLAHLTIASTLPHCHIHLVPADADLTDIRTGFTFYRHEEHRPVLHHQQPTTSLFLENETDITFYEGHLEKIAAAALSRSETRDRLSTHLTEVRP
ncbi:helix-turn-helix domain-containing protein [Amycolatopsis sp. cmx-11-12]|uniref:helix-turn-helix domain-containing protein n=1 Tax=Amycolatopsis sp. cmx-11-12 TaxID=2785795 RepID=UPI003917C709